MKWMSAAAWLLVCVCSCGCFAGAEDVVYAATRLRRENGKYFPVESSHLYRVGEDGTQFRQLTFSDLSDTNPCVSPDRKRILFWRRPVLDGVGDVSLCSITPDGKDLRVLYRFGDVDLARPTELARVLALNMPQRIRLVMDSEGFTQRVKRESLGEAKQTPNLGELSHFEVTVLGQKKPIEVQEPILSPDGRYLLCRGMDVHFASGEEVIEVASGKLIPQSGGFWAGSDNLASWPSGDGGFSLEPVSGGKGLSVVPHGMGKEADGLAFPTSFRANDVQGQKAFWLGGRHETLLLQLVIRDRKGGQAVISGFQPKTGKVLYQLKSGFLEDMDSSGTHFLTTGWNWGDGWMSDGALPMANLAIWDAKTLKAQEIGLETIFTQGACFVPDGMK